MTKDLSISFSSKKVAAAAAASNVAIHSTMNCKGTRCVIKRPREINETNNTASETCFTADSIKKKFAIDNDDALVVGIDEAGRGPVMGPMVYAGAVISLREYDALHMHCHVADSKTLDEVQRNAALLRLHELTSFRSFTVVITAEEISSTMHGRHSRNLNTLSHEAAIRLISEATLDGAGKLCAAFVDTVGPPESYQYKLSGRFAHLQVVVSKKADSIYPIVSAASIVAKVTRDKFISELSEGVGSGYPNDPNVTRWLRTHLHRFFLYSRAHDFVRLSWAPVVALSKNSNICVPISFQHDELMSSTHRKRFANTTIHDGRGDVCNSTFTAAHFTSGVPSKISQDESKQRLFINEYRCNNLSQRTVDQLLFHTPERCNILTHVLHLHAVTSTN